MRKRKFIGTRIVFSLVAGLSGQVAQAAESGEPPVRHEPGPVERLERSLKETGKSIEQHVKEAVDKLENEKLGEKTERKFKETFDGVVEGVERMGKDIEKKFQ